MSTSLSVTAVRASIVFDAIAGNPELVETIHDVHRLPRLSTWTEQILNAAVDELIADGLLVEAADGRLCIKPRGRVA